MKRLFFIGLLFLSACEESFEHVDPTIFNNSISERSDIVTSEDLVNAYYHPTLGEGNPSLTIETKPYKGDMVLITLIHDGLLDDSIKALKIIMIAKKESGTWTVIEIKKNWKCREGRGHVNWGSDLCS